LPAQPLPGLDKEKLRGSRVEIACFLESRQKRPFPPGESTRICSGHHPQVEELGLLGNALPIADEKVSAPDANLVPLRLEVALPQLEQAHHSLLTPWSGLRIDGAGRVPRPRPPVESCHQGPLTFE